MKATLLALALTGCAIPFPESSYNWYREGEPYTHVQFHVVQQAQVDALCPRAFHVMACAVRVRETDRCDVYTAYDPLPESIREHEMKHCKGWNH